LHALDPASGVVESRSFSGEVCAVGPHADGRLLVALGKRLVWARDGEEPQTICAVEADIPSNRCNDGKLDPAGRFWIGTMSRDGSGTGAGSLYRLDGDNLNRILGDLTISNGMGWSRDQRTFFFIDSPRKEVWAFDYEPRTSAISHRRTVVRVPEDFGVPDGLWVAPDDTLWVAHWGAACVCRWDPRNNALLQRVDTGCPHTSSCCLAPDGTLYITTSRLGLDEAALEASPDSGALFYLPPRG
jgi:sugar lactone lactonase YvrE